MRHSRNKSSNLLLLFVISQFLPLVEAQTSSYTISSISPSSTGDIPSLNTTRSSAIVGAVFGAVIGVSLIMVSILFWVRRHTRKAMEAREEAGWESRRKARYGTQNTSYGLDTAFTVPTRISSFNFEKKSTGAVPQPRLNAKSPIAIEQRPYELTRQQSISISNSPAVPYQIPVGGAVESSPSLPVAFASRTNERPIIRSLHRTTSDIFKPLPEPPAVAVSPGAAVTTPPPPPVHSVAFPGSHMHTDNRGEFERSQVPHAVASSANGMEQGRVFGTFGHTHHPYTPYAQDYRPGGQRRRSDASSSSLGIVIGASGSFAKERGHWDITGRPGRDYHLEEPSSDTRPRSQSLSGLQYGNQHQGNSIYKHSASQNPSNTSLSYYPDATSADGLARSYSQTVLARPESRASSITSKKFENQLFSR